MHRKIHKRLVGVSQCHNCTMAILLFTWMVQRNSLAPWCSSSLQVPVTRRPANILMVSLSRSTPKITLFSGLVTYCNSARYSQLLYIYIYIYNILFNHDWSTIIMKEKDQYNGHTAPTVWYWKPIGTGWLTQPFHRPAWGHKQKWIEYVYIKIWFMIQREGFP